MEKKEVIQHLNQVRGFKLQVKIQNVNICLLTFKASLVIVLNKNVKCMFKLRKALSYESSRNVIEIHAVEEKEAVQGQKAENDVNHLSSPPPVGQEGSCYDMNILLCIA